MALFAPVAPLKILRQLDDANQLGNYHLVLAHDVLEHSAGFARLFNVKYQFATVIVDNSVIELGMPEFNVDSMIKACKVFNQCREVVPVLPDVLLNYDKTCKAVEVALRQWAVHEDNRDRWGNTYPLMFVPQGINWKEIVKCAEQFQGEKAIKWIGIARNFTPILKSRWEITQTLQALFPDCKFHQLGFSDDIADDILCTRMDHVTGIDSAVPLRIADYGMKLSLTVDMYPKRGNWWHEVDVATPLMLDNLKLVRKWIEHKPGK